MSTAVTLPQVVVPWHGELYAALRAAAELEDIGMKYFIENRDFVRLWAGVDDEGSDVARALRAARSAVEAIEALYEIAPKCVVRMVFWNTPASMESMKKAVTIAQVMAALLGAKLGELAETDCA